MSDRTLLARAARCYELAGYSAEAASCWSDAGEHARAAPHLEALGRRRDAALAWERAGQHADAARTWERAGEPSAAARAWAAADEPLRAAWIHAHVLGEPARALALLEGVPAGAAGVQAEIALIRARAERRLGVVAELAAALGEGRREALPMIDKALAFAEAERRLDLVATLHAALVEAGAPTRAWRVWAEARFHDATGIPVEARSSSTPSAEPAPSDAAPLFDRGEVIGYPVPPPPRRPDEAP